MVCRVRPPLAVAQRALQLLCAALRAAPGAAGVARAATAASAWTAVVIAACAGPVLCELVALAMHTGTCWMSVFKAVTRVPTELPALESFDSYLGLRHWQVPQRLAVVPHRRLVRPARRGPSHRTAPCSTGPGRAHAQTSRLVRRAAGYLVQCSHYSRELCNSGQPQGAAHSNQVGNEGCCEPIACTSRCLAASSLACLEPATCTETAV